MRTFRLLSGPGVLLSALLALALTLEGCAGVRPREPVSLAPAKSEVEQRDYQTRAFDTTDPQQALRTVIATLQDLGFVIDQASADLGAVSGSRTGRGRQRITVTVRPRGTTQVLVRANAQTTRAAVTDQRQYQRFFAALEKAMFLKAHEVD